MYPFKEGLLPNYFLDVLTLNSQIQKIRIFFYIFLCRTNIQKFSIWFQGPKFLSQSESVSSK